eukprot:CAMPEP_0202476322 /NCGR_PEP_ID=MMETSP1360-20130828/93278_1 /ASSEMBLY_ACC=CAM_ASM_000848 /TAXON_ID=515479 /ORGANISM="Licmophora paradoxa, Strain CCMP2313" /LENGTH=201 /DNA_ID=CAMNT_0049103521 /DNA_START=1289 /DNA_END=1894 /DNA_ORIENTATION=-
MNSVSNPVSIVSNNLTLPSFKQIEQTNPKTTVFNKPNNKTHIIPSLIYPNSPVLSSAQRPYNPTTAHALQQHKTILSYKPLRSDRASDFATMNLTVEVIDSFLGGHIVMYRGEKFWVAGHDMESPGGICDNMVVEEQEGSKWMSLDDVMVLMFYRDMNDGVSAEDMAVVLGQLSQMKALDEDPQTMMATSAPVMMGQGSDV